MKRGVVLEETMGDWAGSNREEGVSLGGMEKS